MSLFSDSGRGNVLYETSLAHSTAPDAFLPRRDRVLTDVLHDKPGGGRQLIWRSPPD